MGDKTLKFYNEHVQDFTMDTIDAKMNNIQENFIKYLSYGSHILDLGCGSGRDSLLFKQRGYKVTALDGSKELCKTASKLIGQEVICKTFNQIDYKSEFDGIWACASLLHVPSLELENVMGKAIQALKPKGIFYVSFKNGSYEGYRQGRYYTDLTNETFGDLIAKFKDINIADQWISGDVRPGRESEKWLNVILIKE